MKGADLARVYLWGLFGLNANAGFSMKRQEAAANTNVMPETMAKEAKAVIFNFIFTPVKKIDKDARAFNLKLPKISQFLSLCHKGVTKNQKRVNFGFERWRPFALKQCGHGL